MDMIPSVGSWLTDAPWRLRAVSLIFIDGDRITQSDTRSGKQALSRMDGGTLLVTWHGVYRTDVRLVQPEDRSAVARVLS